MRMYRDRWVTGDGSVLRISEMETEHLRNCLSLMDRWLRFLKTYCPFPVCEHDEERGAYLQTLYYSLMDSGPEDVWPPYARMVTELRRRATGEPTIEAVRSLVYTQIEACYNVQ